VIIPLLQLLFLYYAIGGNPIGLKLGIVNNEVTNYRDCSNDSFIATIAHEETCDLNKISCNFLESIDDSLAAKVFYKSFDDAYVDARKGKIAGIIKFASNFTESTMKVQNEATFFNGEDEASLDNSVIEVFLDKTNYQRSIFLERRLYRIFENYSVDLMTKCQRPARLGKLPIAFMKPIYGNNQSDLKLGMAPAMILL